MIHLENNDLVNKPVIQLGSKVVDDLTDVPIVRVVCVDGHATLTCVLVLVRQIALVRFMSFNRKSSRPGIELCGVEGDIVLQLSIAYCNPSLFQVDSIHIV